MVLSARPPHRDSVPVEHRWHMLERACADEPRLVADDREIQRIKASYTLDTLRNQRRRAPHEPLFWIIGMDSLLTFRSWYRWWRILDLAHLVVVRRPGYPLRLDPTLRAIVRRRGWIPSAADRKRNNIPSGVAGRILLLEEAMLRVSSSEIRRQLQKASAGLATKTNTKTKKRRGRAANVPPSIADYIEHHGLYRS